MRTIRCDVCGREHCSNCQDPSVPEVPHGWERRKFNKYDEFWQDLCPNCIDSINVRVNLLADNEVEDVPCPSCGFQIAAKQKRIKEAIVKGGDHE